MFGTKHDDMAHRYALARHHAWAGSVLLAVLLAIRLFFFTQENTINEPLFISIGVLLIIYILVALFFTYRYRLGLKQQSSTQLSSETIGEKDRLKLEKKTQKAQVKQQKKKLKAKEKQ